MNNSAYRVVTDAPSLTEPSQMNSSKYESTHVIDAVNKTKVGDYLDYCYSSLDCDESYLMCCFNYDSYVYN